MYFIHPYKGRRVRPSIHRETGSVPTWPGSMLSAQQGPGIRGNSEPMFGQINRSVRVIYKSIVYALLWYSQNNLGAIYARCTAATAIHIRAIDAHCVYIASAKSEAHRIYIYIYITERRRDNTKCAHLHILCVVCAW